MGGMKIPPVFNPVEPEQNPLPKGGGSSTITLLSLCTLVYFSIPTIYNGPTNKNGYWKGVQTMDLGMHRHGWARNIQESHPKWEWKNYTVTVSWECRCGARVIQAQTFREPSKESEQPEVEVIYADETA